MVSAGKPGFATRARRGGSKAPAASTWRAAAGGPGAQARHEIPGRWCRARALSHTRLWVKLEQQHGHVIRWMPNLPRRPLSEVMASRTVLAGFGGLKLRGRHRAWLAGLRLDKWVNWPVATGSDLFSGIAPGWPLARVVSPSPIRLAALDLMYRDGWTVTTASVTIQRTGGVVLPSSRDRGTSRVMVRRPIPGRWAVAAYTPTPEHRATAGRGDRRLTSATRALSAGRERLCGGHRRQLRLRQRSGDCFPAAQNQILSL